MDQSHRTAGGRVQSCDQSGTLRWGRGSGKGTLPGCVALSQDFWGAIFTVIGCKTWRVLVLLGTTGRQLLSQVRWEEKHLWTRTHRPCCSKDNLQKWHWSSACWRGALEATEGRRQEDPFKMMWRTSEELFFLIIKASYKQKWKVPFIQNKIKDQTGDKKRTFVLISLLS